MGRSVAASKLWVTVGLGVCRAVRAAVVVAGIVVVARKLRDSLVEAEIETETGGWIDIRTSISGLPAGDP